MKNREIADLIIAELYAVAESSIVTEEYKRGACQVALYILDQILEGNPIPYKTKNYSVVEWKEKSHVFYNGHKYLKVT